MSATGYLHKHLPDSTERDRLLVLVRLGLRFADQHRGRRPGVLRRHVEAIVRERPEITLDQLVTELAIDAMRHELHGETPIVRVDRGFECVQYVEHGQRREVGFRYLANLLAVTRAAIA